MPVRFLPRRLVPVIVILIGAVLGRFRTAPKAESISTAAPSIPVAPTDEDRTGPAPSAPKASPVLAIPAALDARHRAQIELVVQSMDLSGHPPARVVQGGRRGGVKGEFTNAEGRLPRQRRGYWVESDVWPKDGPRDAERLIFGREREVYWTRDHYQTFSRLR